VQQTTINLKEKEKGKGLRNIKQRRNNQWDNVKWDNVNGKM